MTQRPLAQCHFEVPKAVFNFFAKDACTMISYLGRTVLIAVRARAFMMKVFIVVNEDEE